MSIKIIKATEQLKNDISGIATFEVIGDPNVNVVAFKSTSISLSNIVDAFEQKKWNLNILQNLLHLLKRLPK